MPLPDHPTATQMMKEKHLRDAFEATGLLLQVIIQADSHFKIKTTDQCDAQDAYTLLNNIMRRNGLLRPAPKLASVKTHSVST